MACRLVQTFRTRFSSCRFVSSAPSLVCMASTPQCERPGARRFLPPGLLLRFGFVRSFSADAAAHDVEDDDEPSGDESEREELALPAAWRDAGLWVDLDMERAGLVEGDDDELKLESPWGSEEFPHPDSGVIFPHAAIEEHRSRPFFVPQGETMPDGAAKENLQNNRERLAALWRLSNSHGISWDELDQAYVSFAKDGKQRFDEWARPQGEDPPLALVAKQKALRRATKRVERFCTYETLSAKEYYSGRIKRLASKYYRKEKQRWLDPWKPGRLTSHLQQLVVARMLRRETGERSLHFRRPRNNSDKVSQRPTESKKI